MKAAKIKVLVKESSIHEAIRELRGVRVILDSDLARIYGTTTKRLLEQFRRNRKKFPRDFAYLLTDKEVTGLRSQSATSNKRGGRRTKPIAVTEHGAIMAATLLNSDEAIAMSIFVVRAFVRMREVPNETRELSHRLDEIEVALSNRLDGHEETLESIFEELRVLLDPPQ